MKIIESGEGFEIVEEDSEYLYKVKLPELTQEEKRFMGDVKEKAIEEVGISIESTDPKKRKRLLHEEVLRKMIEYLKYREEVGLKKNPPRGDKLKAMAGLIVNDMIGYGPIDPLLEDDNLEEVMVIGPNLPVYVVHRKYGTMGTSIAFEDDESIQRTIEKIGRFAGRKIDIANPMLDTRLPDGSRVNATLNPPSLDGSTLTIRKFKAEALTIIDIIKFGTLDSKLAAFLWLAVDGMGVRPSNVLISGGTGSGKTTTLNCLALFIRKQNRVITIEDTAELQLPIKHLIRLETRPPNIEGKGGLNFNQLLINTLRMRPDRIVLGEVRGEEAKTLFVAMNTGHDGCLGTVHANSASETVNRLLNPPMNVPLIMIPALDLIVMQNRFSVMGKTRRRITEVSEVAGTEMDKVLLNKIYEYDPKEDVIKPTGTPSTIKQDIASRAGITGEELNMEFERREIVLQYLVEKNIAKLDEGYNWVQGYYKDPDQILDKIQASL